MSNTEIYFFDIEDLFSPNVLSDHNAELLRSKDQYELQTLIAYGMLGFVFENRYGYTIDQNCILKDCFGKPYTTFGKHISISHSNNIVAAAVSENDIGIDIEIIEPLRFDVDMYNAYFSSDEIAFIRSCSSPKIGFAVVWTIKESYLKYLGKGIEHFSDVFLNETNEKYVRNFLLSNKNKNLFSFAFVCDEICDLRLIHVEPFYAERIIASFIKTAK